MLAPVDKKGKPIGLTDVEDIPYSYANFKNKKDMVFHGLDSYQDGLKALLKISKRNHAEALVYLSNDAGFLHFGYIAGDKIYLCAPYRSQFFELDSLFKKHDLNTPYGLLHSDKVPVSTYEYWNFMKHIVNWNSTIDERTRFTGHTPPEKIRLCK